MAKKRDALDELGKELCAGLHFNPTSNSTKPLYVANSLFRACTGIECNVEDLHEWVVSERRSKAKSSEMIAVEYADALYNSGPGIVDDIKEIRFFLEKLYNPDSTVWPSYRNSVLNIPSKWFIRSYVPAEAGIGEFLFNILNTPISGKVSPAIATIEQALMDDDDDLSRTVRPLIVRRPEEERIIRSERDSETISFNKTEKIIRAGFDRLAENCNVYSKMWDSNSLLVLRRMVSYAMFAVFFYLEDVNRVKYGGPRIPLLLDADGERGAIEQASEACFIACKKSVEAYTVSFIYEWLKNSNLITDISSESACKEYITHGFALKDYTKESGEKLGEIILQHISSGCRAGEEPLLATAKALQFAIYTYTFPNTTPSDFCNVLGVKAGFVGPSGNAAKYKRLLINSFLLETLVLSAVDTASLNNGIELRELGDALRSSYNILIGTDTDIDFGILDAYGIAAVTPENLRGELANNARDIADMLISMGLAKRYADGVTIIGWGL